MFSLPQRMAQRGLYYGWVIVAIVFVLGFVRSPLTGFLFGVFLKPMTEEFGWSRAEFSGAVTLGTLVGGVSAYFAGRIVDRYGPRVLMVAAATMMGAVYLGLAGVNSLVTYYVAYVVGRAIVQSAIGGGIRATVVSKWFVRLRGRAISFSAVGEPLGGASLALLAQLLMNAYDWRVAWLTFGIMTLVLAVAPAALFLRRAPEDLGLRPDGVAPERETGETTAELGTQARVSPVREYSWPFRDVLRTPTFWILCLAWFLASIGASAVGFHMVPYFTDVGINATLAASSVSIWTLSFAGGIIFWGLGLERVNIRYSFPVAISMLMLGVVLIMVTRTPAVMFPAAVVFGFAQGGWFMHSQSVWAMYFGRRYLGAIQGLAVFFQLMGNSMGPLFAGLVFDTTDSYQTVFRVTLAFGGVIFLLLLLARRPVPPVSLASSTG